MPESLTTDTTDFVLLSSSGVTPSISGYNASDTFLVSAVASAGNIKITTTSNTDQAAGYCGYTSDGNGAPSRCTGSSLTEIGFRGTQANINAALATLSFKGDGSTGTKITVISKSFRLRRITCKPTPELTVIHLTIPPRKTVPKISKDGCQNLSNKQN